MVGWVVDLLVVCGVVVGAVVLAVDMRESCERERMAAECQPPR